ncbi:hypothetical protein ONJ45_27390, partial [Salmonella enterica subsp. enterica serovar Virginia]|nr:hypothetical protein [Salmonella enterica subsp. enterica serovar Virginia]
LTGVGAAQSSKLAKIGLHTVQDLLLHLPLRYEDRTHLYPIGEQKAINYLMQFAHKVSGKYRGVAKLEGNTKAKVLQVLATFAYA